ncbi:hypothetical protein RhiirA5_433549 [Rhizophagus irregularis]|uniref:Uncharacterized protein n=1 Tax=Rhizophagus irregularis TaxID=588596 RepID=A0A2N0NRK2_9GLOM|nr:hypothetical protein RhiirA5_433549 [Rhizophagus irregularis]GET54756.1 hypothetical protein GLOIN_2v1846618 [Rhizophagus irregularis DAOM 181602=DAOM 197198]
MNKKIKRILTKSALEFVSEFSVVYFHTITLHIGLFIENGFLKNLFEKNPSVAKDKAQLLIEMFGDAVNPKNFTHFICIIHKDGQWS